MMTSRSKCERDLTVITWMLGTEIALTLINLGVLVQVLARLPVR